MNPRPYVISSLGTRRVSNDCLVSWNARKYSAPWPLAGHDVRVREFETGVLAVEHEGTAVARHEVAGENVLSEPETDRRPPPKGWALGFAMYSPLDEESARHEAYGFGLSLLQGLSSGGTLQIRLPQWLAHGPGLTLRSIALLGLSLAR